MKCPVGDIGWAAINGYGTVFAVNTDGSDGANPEPV